MANITLTNGEQYTFGKVAGTPVILDSSDNVQAIKTFRNLVEISKDAGSVNGLLSLAMSATGNTVPGILLNNTSTGPGDATIKFQSNSQKFWAGIDGTDDYNFKIGSVTALTDGVNPGLQVSQSKDVEVGRHLYVADRSFHVNGTSGDLVIGNAGNGHDNSIIVYESDTTVRNRIQIGADSTSGFINATYNNGGSRAVEIRSAGTLAAKHQHNNHHLYGLVSTAASYNNVAYDTSDSQLVYQTSTRKIKTNITSLDTGSLGDVILDMRPVSFNEVGTNKLSYGFIAEECAEIDPMLAVYGPDYVYNSGSTSFATASADTPDELKHINGSTEYLLYTTGSAPVNINQQTVLTAAIAKIQDLEARLKALENA